MENVYMPLQLAPGNLTQPILPNWSFSLFNVNLGTSSDVAIELEALQKVGSYGRQIGHMAEAMELIINKFKLLENDELSQSEKDTLRVFLGDVSAVRKIKPPHALAKPVLPASGELSQACEKADEDMGRDEDRSTSGVDRK